MFTLERFFDVKPVASGTMIFSQVMCPYQTHSSSPYVLPSEVRHQKAEEKTSRPTTPLTVWVPWKRTLSLSIIKTFRKLRVGTWQKHPVGRCHVCSSFYLQWWEIYTLVLLLSEFPFLHSPPLPSPLCTFPQIMADSSPTGLLKETSKAAVFAERHPRGCLEWDSWRSLDICMWAAHHGSHHGMLGMGTEPLCCTVSGSIFHLWRADLVRKCGEGVFIWILVNLTVFQVLFFFLRKR